MPTNPKYPCICKVCERNILACFPRQVVCSPTAVDAETHEPLGYGCREIHQAELTAAWKRDAPAPGYRWRIFTRDGFRCVYCGDSPAANQGCVLTVDHVVPRSRGGASTIENMVTACKSCNAGKRDSFLNDDATLKLVDRA